MKTIEITIPGSKSLTNRAIIMASLSSGISKISNFSNGLDSQIMVRALKKLGVKIKKNKDELQITGNGGIFSKFSGLINAGNAGTVARFLTALITLVPGKVIINKSKRMRERPIKELDEALRKIRTGKISIKGNISSQFISSLLMIAPVLKKGLVIRVIDRLVSRSYVDMTIDLLNKFGVKVINNQYRKFIVEKNQELRPIVYEVEGDASGASYFWAIAAITRKKIKVKNINPKSSQGDIRFVDILEKIGCQVRRNIKEKWIEVKGPKALRGTNVNMIDIPDTAQTLAVVSAFAKGKTKITGLATLKFKETDRLLALKKELGKMRIKSEISDDSIEVAGGSPQKATIETYEDHRMAMAFAVAKAKIPKLIIKNPEVVKKSFPDFWNKWRQI